MCIRDRSFSMLSATGYGADILAAYSMEKDTGFADTRAYELL